MPLRLTFERRGTHDLPAGLPPPSPDWRVRLKALARECAGCRLMSPQCFARRWEVSRTGSETQPEAVNAL